MNWYGFYTLYAKEVKRFLKVASQTILTPVITVLLYLLVFSSALSDHVQVYDGVAYTTFLVPGLIMMTIMQNAFANSSSSLFQSKMMGNLVFMLLSPLSELEVFLAFALAAVTRGVFVGIGVWLVTLWFVDLPMHSPFILIGFAILGSMILGTLGLIASIWAERWDHVSGFQNFIILPLSFLSGVFYSIKSLPDFWYTLSQYNPFFYMIDGFRYGFFGVSDSDITLSFIILSIATVVISIICLLILKSGYKMRT